MQDFIKGASGLTGWNLESHTRGMEALRCYTSTGDCRHAALVNFFQPSSLPAQGPCEGGCDNCTRRYVCVCVYVCACVCVSMCLLAPSVVVVVTTLLCCSTCACDREG